jgi:hypothetical protein
MPESDLIQAHDELAQNTVVGVDFYLDELSRRAFNRASEAALLEAVRARKLAVANMVVAVVAVLVQA